MVQYHWRPGRSGPYAQGQGPCYVLPLVRQLLATPAAPRGRKGQSRHRGTVGMLLWMLGQRGLGHPPSFSPLTSDRGPWPLGCCSVETAPFSTSIPNRPQLRPRPRGKALAGLSLARCPGMSGHTPCLGQYRWRPGRSGPGCPRAGAVLG